MWFARTSSVTWAGFGACGQPGTAESAARTSIWGFMGLLMKKESRRHKESGTRRLWLSSLQENRAKRHPNQLQSVIWELCWVAFFGLPPLFPPGNHSAGQAVAEYVDRGARHVEQSVDAQ